MSKQTKVGKYELVRKLATGGMAEVFLAKAEWALGVEKTVVVKRILSHLAEDQNFVEMFLSEAKLAAQLSHPNIVQIFEFGEAEGVYYLAMEYIDGPNLRTLGTRAHELGRPVPFTLCAKMIAMACEALAYAHEFCDPETGTPLMLVHRDISPDNIILARNGALKVVDFGIAKAVTQSHQTKTGLIKGKLAYMPPEQLKTKSIDKRADVYALGVVLYELVAGKKPFDAESEVTMMHAVLYEPMVPIRQRRPDVPEELEKIIDKALARERDERYPDCRTMYADLERFVMSSGEPIGAFQISQLVAELQAGPVGAAAMTPPPGMATPGGRRHVTQTPAPHQRQTTPAQPAGVAEQQPPPASMLKTGTDGEPGSGMLLTEKILGSALLGMQDAPQAKGPTTRPGVERGEKKAPPPRPQPPAAPRLPEPEPPTLRAEEPAKKPKPKPPPPARPPPKERGGESSSGGGLGGKGLKVGLAAGGGLLLIAGVVGVLSFSGGDPAPPPPPPPDPVVQVDPTPPPPPPDPVVQVDPASPPPDPDPQTDPQPDPADPQPPPPDEPVGEISLTVKSDPPARIRFFVAKKLRASGRSPATAKLPPGVVDVEVYDDSQGLSKRERFSLKAGDDAVRRTITVGKGTLLLNSVPWAKVKVDGKDLDATPVKAEVYEGTHTVFYECSNGKKDTQRVTVEAGQSKQVRSKCGS